MEINNIEVCNLLILNLTLNKNCHHEKCDLALSICGASFHKKKKKKMEISPKKFSNLIQKNFGGLATALSHLFFQKISSTSFFHPASPYHFTPELVGPVLSVFTLFIVSSFGINATLPLCPQGERFCQFTRPFLRSIYPNYVDFPGFLSVTFFIILLCFILAVEHIWTTVE